MGISYKDFLRLLPIALKNIEYQLVERLITFEYKSGNIDIELGPERERKIASLVLPTMNIVFKFSDLTPNEITEFLEKFDRTYQRGGG